MPTNLTAKEAEGLSYLELKALLDSKKEQEIEKITKELTAAEGIVASLKEQLAHLGHPVAPTAAPARRGRKPKNEFNPTAKSPKKTKGKRGAVGEAIKAFVVGKGKAGAHVKDIAAHLGAKPTNVTAFFYAKANKKNYKKVRPATFAFNGK